MEFAKLVFLASLSVALMISTGDGMPPGTYKVVIVAGKRVNKRADAKDEFNVSGKLIHVVPPIYDTKETTPLTKTISASDSSVQYDIETYQRSDWSESVSDV